MRRAPRPRLRPRTRTRAAGSRDAPERPKMAGSTATQTWAAVASRSPDSRYRDVAVRALRSPTSSARPVTTHRSPSNGPREHPGRHGAEHHRPARDVDGPSPRAVEGGPEQRHGNNAIRADVGLARRPCRRDVDAGDGGIDRAGPQPQAVAGGTPGAAGEALGEGMVVQPGVALTGPPRPPRTGRAGRGRARRARPRTGVAVSTGDRRAGRWRSGRRGGSSWAPRAAAARTAAPGPPAPAARAAQRAPRSSTRRCPRSPARGTGAGRRGSRPSAPSPLDPRRQHRHTPGRDPWLSREPPGSGAGPRPARRRGRRSARG